MRERTCSMLFVRVGFVGGCSSIVCFCWRLSLSLSLTSSVAFTGCVVSVWVRLGEYGCATVVVVIVSTGSVVLLLVGCLHSSLSLAKFVFTMVLGEGPWFGQVCFYWGLFERGSLVPTGSAYCRLVLDWVPGFFARGTGCLVWCCGVVCFLLRSFWKGVLGSYGRRFMPDCWFVVCIQVCRWPNLSLPWSLGRVLS